MLFRILAVLLFCLLGACSLSEHEQPFQFQTKSGPARIDKLDQTKYLIASNQTTANIHYEIDAPLTTSDPVDILILFDRTGSMKREIAETAKAAKAIVNDIQKTAPNTRFSVAAVSDYSPLFTSSADKRTWLLMTDFTLEADKVASACNNIQLSNGGDLPEAYSRGLFEASMLNWRKEAKKIIIFFGDSTDHPLDPGRDEKLGTADDLTMEIAIHQLQAKNIHVIGIYTDSQREVVRFFKKLSHETGGEAKALSNATSSAQTVIASVKKELSNNAVLKANGSYRDWISTQNIPAGPHESNYKININVPDNIDAGVYEIPLYFDSNNKDNPLVRGLSNTPIHIKVVTGWYNHPMILWLPLVAFLLLLAWRSFQMLCGGYSDKKSVTSRFQYTLSEYPAYYIIIDALFYLSVICSGTAIYLCWHQLVLSQVL